MKTVHRYAVAVGLLTLLTGCSRWKYAEAPAGFAIVREHMISVPRNDPPVTSALDFTITEVDGKPVKREAIPPWVDMQRGALMTAGSHEIKALVSPHVRPANHRPAETVFKAEVQSTKVYYLVDKDGGPVLVEMKPQTK